MSNRPHLQVVCVHLAGDQVPEDGTFQPERYVVRFGLSRSLTPYERQLLIDDPSAGIDGTNDLMWMDAVDTTLEEFRDGLPELKALLGRTEQAAAALETAAVASSEALAAAFNAETARRLALRDEINDMLKDLLDS